MKSRDFDVLKVKTMRNTAFGRASIRSVVEGEIDEMVFLYRILS